MGKSKSKKEEKKKEENKKEKEEPPKKSTTPLPKNSNENQDSVKRQSSSNVKANPINTGKDSEGNPLIGENQMEGGGENPIQEAAQEKPKPQEVKDWETWHSSEVPFEDKFKILKEKPSVLFSNHKNSESQEKFWLSVIPNDWKSKILTEYQENVAKMEEIVDSG